MGHREKYAAGGASKANNTNASSLLTSLRPSTKNSDVRVEPNERGHQLPTLRGKQLTPDEVQLLKDNNYFGMEPDQVAIQLGLVSVV